MEFYESISSSYDYIFPANPAQLRFIMRYANPENYSSKILDVGSATGSLAIALAQEKQSVWAFDYDAEMVRLSKLKKQDLGLSSFPIFEQLDMLLIETHYAANSFDRIICFGNTLVHLQTEAEIMQFLNGAFAVLSSGGKILIQILNYDYILSEKMEKLPLIENEHIRFERFYAFSSSSRLVGFKTILTEKKNDSTVSNTVQLNPIGKSELEKLLLDVGFCNLEYYGNFMAEKLQSNSLPLIVVAEKR